MFFSCIPRQSLEESSFLKACSCKGWLFLGFCINFYDFAASEGILRLCYASPKVPTDRHIYLCFISDVFLSLFSLSPCLSPFLTHFAPLHSTLLSPPCFFLFFNIRPCSCRATYLPAWMRPCWPGLRLWRPWTSPCPRARRTRSSPTPHTTR